MQSVQPPSPKRHSKPISRMPTMRPPTAAPSLDSKAIGTRLRTNPRLPPPSTPLRSLRKNIKLRVRRRRSSWCDGRLCINGARHLRVPSTRYIPVLGAAGPPRKLTRRPESLPGSSQARRSTLSDIFFRGDVDTARTNPPSSSYSYCMRHCKIKRTRGRPRGMHTATSGQPLGGLGLDHDPGGGAGSASKGSVGPRAGTGSHRGA